MRRKVTLLLAASGAIALIVVWADRADVFRVDSPGVQRPASIPEQLDNRTETIVVQVRVIPAGGVLAWHLRVRSGHGEAPLADGRGHGDADIPVEVPPGNHVARIDVEGAAEPLTQSFEVRAGESKIVSFVLYVPGSISGKVVDVHASGLQGAAVMLFPSAGDRRTRRPYDIREPVRECSTDGDGSFVFDRCDPRLVYEIAAVTSGYVPERVGGVRVEAGRASSVELILKPAGRITGRLVGPDGQVLAGVTLNASKVEQDTQSLTKWALEGNAVTGDDGGFAFESLGGGVKKILTTPEYVLGKTVIGQWVVEVSPNQTASLGDLVIGSSAVRLRLERPDGTVPESARVRAVLVPGENEPQAVAVILYVFADSRGCAEIQGLPAGRLDLLAVDMTPGIPAEMSARLSLAFDGRFIEQVVRLEPRTQPERTAGATIALPEMAPGSFVLVFSVDRILGSACSGARRRDAAEMSIMPSSDGRAELLFVSDGRYARRALDLSGGRSERLAITPDQPGGRLEVRVSEHGLPARNVAVLVALSGDADADYAAVGFTNSEGHLVLDGMPSDLAAWIRVAGPRGVSAPMPVQWESSSVHLEVDVSR